MNRIAPAIAFEPFAASHLSLMESWLHRPHIRSWWGDPATELGYIRDMIEGRDTTQPFIFLVDGEPTGYIQRWSIGDNQIAALLDEYPWLAALPADAVGVDLSIGDSNRLGVGIGSRVLHVFSIALHRDGHSTIIIDPDPANTRAVRAYTKAGFRPIPRLIGRSGDSLIMKFDPSASEY